MLFVDKGEAVYGTAKQPESSFIISTVPVQQLIDGSIDTGQVVHMELLWVPKGGATPLSPSATNISIRHVVFAAGEIGVYEGAGFAMPDGDVGDNTLSITVLSGTLRLKHATAGFVDKLGDAEMLGAFKATLNPSKAAAARFALSQLVTDAMGESMWVQRDDSDSGAGDCYITRSLADIEADLNLVLARLESNDSAGVTTP